MRNSRYASFFAAMLVLMGCGGGAPDVGGFGPTDAGGGPGAGGGPANPVDSGLPVDAGGARDAGASPDAGLPFDAGARIDAGTPFDAGTAVRPGRPAAPTNLALAKTGDLIELSWRDNSDNESEFVVTATHEYFSHHTTTRTEIRPANATTWSMTHDDPSVIGYAFTVAARNRAGMSAPSNSVTLPVGPPTQAPSAPTNLVATPGDGQVSLRWDASPGATAYEVLRTQVRWEPLLVVATVSQTTHIDIGLTNGTTYYYAVVAKNGARSSLASQSVSATPVSAGP